ncbi:MAG: N-acetylglucosamine-6-phosphate deacetylase [Acidobacteria bacterium]|nr:N-acetylglucosamine-6-phosphate deacetylase [Acidobacteriota bacterium]
MKLYGRAFIRGAIEADTLVTIDDATIGDITRRAHPPADAEPFDGVLVPGFIDTHIHGGDGADFMDASEEANERIAAFHARQGTTAMAATTLSASRGDLKSSVDAIVRSLHRSSAAEIVAVHLEGPYINAERAGAQDRSSIRPADIHELAALLAEAPRLAWIVTVAPEVAGVQPLIEHFRDRVTFAIGHTMASYADAVAAVSWGAKHFTHLFNAMTSLHHREPGVVGAAMVSEEATVELIADGIHVHHAALRIAGRMMPNRVVLVTDAMRACGMQDGTYRLYEYEVTVADGAARLADGTLAGSVLTMARAVQNMVELAGLPLESVLPFATTIPAKLLGVGDRKGTIESGYDADLVVLTDKLEVERVLVRGHAV